MGKVQNLKISCERKYGWRESKKDRERERGKMTDRFYSCAIFSPFALLSFFFYNSPSFPWKNEWISALSFVWERGERAWRMKKESWWRCCWLWWRNGREKYCVRGWGWKRERKEDENKYIFSPQTAIKIRVWWFGFMVKRRERETELSVWTFLSVHKRLMVK